MLLICVCGMSQVFLLWVGLYVLFVLFVLVLIVGGVFVGWCVFIVELYVCDVVVNQLVLFSYVYYVGEVGLDCCYCYSMVEIFVYVGMLLIFICMICYLQLFID